MSSAEWCGDRVAHWARTAPDRLAVTDPDHRLTYAELDHAVERTVGVFKDAGAVPGDRVMVICENSVAAAVALIAVHRLRGWVVPVNARMKGPEVARIAAHCEPRLIVVTSSISAEARAHADAMGARDEMGLGATIATPEYAGEPEAVSDDPAEQVAALMYTTGTTGAPKGVMLTHRNLCETAKRIGEMRPHLDDEHVHCVLPISHIFGLSVVLGAALRYGARVSFSPRFDPAAVLDAFATDAVTAFSGVPAMYAAITALGEIEGVSAPRLRTLGSGGAPLDPEVKARVEWLFGLPLGNGYGLTETAPLGASTPVGLYQNGTSVGPASPGIEIRIAASDGTSLPSGEVGEIWLRGRSVMKGYYKAPDLTKAAITPDGWFCSGDLGWLDGRGWLTISGRLKELIIRSGFNVFPPEIEGVLTKDPAVALAAVVGRKLPDGNEVPIAFLQPKPGRIPDIDALRSRVEAELSRYKHPSEYHVFDALPAAGTGKILKSKLLDLLEA